MKKKWWIKHSTQKNWEEFNQKKFSEAKTKWLIRFLTPRNWRGHKRRIFFEALFEDIKDDRVDGSNYGTFSLIKSDSSSYRASCHEMASNYNYNPLTDRMYRMDIGKHFAKFHIQTYDSLYAIIERISSPWEIITKKTGTFKIRIAGIENEKPFDFPYVKDVKF